MRVVCCGCVGRYDTWSVHRRPHSRCNKRSMSGTVNDNDRAEEPGPTDDDEEAAAAGTGTATGAGIDEGAGVEPSLLFR